jgi:hypothetical protein
LIQREIGKRYERKQIVLNGVEGGERIVLVNGSRKRERENRKG